ncbi:MAG: phosphotransferase [Pseudomonadota bacterium]
MAQVMGAFNSASNTGEQRFAQLDAWVDSVLDGRTSGLEPASADASFRRYFRVRGGARSFVCMDAPPPQEDVGPFIAVAARLAAAGVHAPEVLAADQDRGFLLLTDLGTQTYLDALDAGESAGPLYRGAVDTLVQLHAEAAADGLPPYDEARLHHEMDLFDQWFTGELLGLELSTRQAALLMRTKAALAREALAAPQGFVHRDYHSRNLMVGADGRPGVIDFQDAMHGPMVYDLVSLLRDSYVRWPAARIDEWIARYLRLAADRGVKTGEPAAYRRSFDLVGAQRHIKVCGIFSRLYLRDGKPDYLKDIPLTLEHLQTALRPHAEYAEFSLLLRTRVAPAMLRTLERIAAEGAL